MARRITFEDEIDKQNLNKTNLYEELIIKTEVEDNCSHSQNNTKLDEELIIKQEVEDNYSQNLNNTNLCEELIIKKEVEDNCSLSPNNIKLDKELIIKNEVEDNCSQNLNNTDLNEELIIKKEVEDNYSQNLNNSNLCEELIIKKEIEDNCSLSPNNIKLDKELIIKKEVEDNCRQEHTQKKDIRNFTDTNSGTECSTKNSEQFESVIRLGSQLTKTIEIPIEYEGNSQSEGNIGMGKPKGKRRNKTEQEMFGININEDDHSQEDEFSDKNKIFRKQKLKKTEQRCISTMEKNTDNSQDERNRKRKIDDTPDDTNKKREARLQKGRERAKRHREKKRNEDAALVIGGLTDVYNEKREERLRYDREKSKRYREKKKNEVAAHSFSDFSSDSSVSQMKRDRKKQNSKRYRDKIRALNLLNISNRKNVSHSVPSSQIAGPSTIDVPFMPPVINSSQIASPSTKDVAYVPPIFCSSQLEGISPKDVPCKPPIHPNKNSTESRVLQSHSSSQAVDPHPPNIHLQTYSAFHQNSSAHRQFEKDFVENEFGLACDICDRLWFKNDLKYIQNNGTTRNIEFIRTLLSNIALQEIKVCTTCFLAIQKQRIPPLSVYNGFKYPPLPDCLKDFPLDLVTERLISPRIPFMQIRRLRHVPGQNGIYGQVINVPIEVNTMVNLLPRLMDDDHAITVQIKRKVIHKSSHVYGIVGKRKIKAWLRYLKNTPLYNSFGVSVDDVFLNDINNDVKDEIIFDEDGDNDILEKIPIDESLMAQQQTLMWNEDMYLRIAPGEGIVPKSFLFDEHAEELSFPQIYLGQFREFRHGLSVTPFMMATSELRRSDRRGVTPQHLLYMAMNIMRIRMKESLNIALRHVGQGITITKEQIQSDDYVHGCIETNLAFLRSIPNSAYYWAERKRDLFSMIRQYGKPTVFFTIRANEIGWPKLLQLLHNLKNNAGISAEEAADLHFIEKSTLANEDAVTCALYFNKLVNTLLKILQSKRYSPFKKYRILHYFERIEFQHRGSPHAHILAWLDNAPEDALGRDYNKAIDLIDFLISVSAAEASGNIGLQTHKHTFTCYKGIASRRQQKCRFDAPFMPVKTTMILTPMPDTEDGFRQYKAKYNTIRKNLENYEYNGFQSFYDENDIGSDEEYVNIIRSGIKRPQVYPKREPCEKWHHTFNPFIFNVVKSKTDFQFITEEYSCATYVVEYVNKTNRGISSLRRKIIEIMNEHPEFNLFDITKNVSINLLNHTEMTSQEAAWYLLREPMSKSSNIIVYIPTIWPVERQRVKKTMKEISELEDDSTEIWKENWFDKYEKRPEDLSHMSLAQFVAKYHKNNKGDYVLREEPKVIRYRNYDMGTDYNEYRREMVTLHLPFRNEEAEILAESRYLELYEENVALILERRKEFESNLDIQKTLEICRELCSENLPVDVEEINDVVGRIPAEKPFAELYDNTNAELRLALFNKLGAIAKNK